MKEFKEQENVIYKLYLSCTLCEFGRFVSVWLKTPFGREHGIGFVWEVVGKSRKAHLEEEFTRVERLDKRREMGLVEV